MSVQVERLEHNMAKLTITVPAEDFKKEIEKVYQKNRNRFQVEGFRKGKAPRRMIERIYGQGIFYEDAANACINATYPAAADECGLEIASMPGIDVIEIEEGKDLVYTAEVAVKPEVEVSDYKGLEVPKTVIEVTDEEIEAELKKEQEKNSRMVDVDDRAVADGDTVTLDYSGAIDGVKFDGGTAEGHELVIGSGSFIPGFEDQLIGMNLEETKDVVVTFPAEYHAADLAGKEAVFTCTIHKIQTKELPAIDDELAQDVSEFETLDEYKADVKKNLLEKKEKEARTAKEDAAVNALIEKTEMDIPDAMIDTQVERMFDEMSYNIQSQGLPMAQYLQYMGTTPAQFKESIRPQALKRLQTRLVLEAVAEKEDIQISDERLAEETKNIAEAYGLDPEKFAADMPEDQKNQLKMDMQVQDAITLLADNAVEVEKAEEPAEAAE